MAGQKQPHQAEGLRPRGHRQASARKDRRDGGRVLVRKVAGPVPLPTEKNTTTLRPSVSPPQVQGQPRALRDAPHTSGSSTSSIRTPEETVELRLCVSALPRRGVDIRDQAVRGRNCDMAKADQGPCLGEKARHDAGLRRGRPEFVPVTVVPGPGPCVVNAGPEPADVDGYFRRPACVRRRRPAAPGEQA